MKNKTLDYYNKNARQWTIAHIFGKKLFGDHAISKLKKILPKGKILEIGSGSGNDAKKLVKAGYEYVGTDGSKGFVKLARELNPKINFLIMPVEKLNFPKNTFDGFWTSATLLHIPKKNINLVLQKIKNTCKVGAIGIITLKEGKGEVVEKETNRWFSFYEKSEFEKILTKNGFIILDFENLKDRKKEKPKWLLFYVKII